MLFRSHLKILAYDQFGNENFYEAGSDYATADTYFFYPVPAYTNNLGIIVPPAGLPSTIHLEVGVLEPDAFQQLRSMPTAQTQSNFLGKAGGKIQIYRQNISIPGATR